MGVLHGSVGKPGGQTHQGWHVRGALEEGRESGCHQYIKRENTCASGATCPARNCVAQKRTKMEAGNSPADARHQSKESLLYLPCLLRVPHSTDAVGWGIRHAISFW